MLPLIALATGCRGGSDLMPLDVGHSWNYIVKAGFDTYVTPIKVDREVSVANTRGVELASTLGTSRMAWTGDSLVAERLAGTQFVPPIPLLFKAEETSDRPWKGHLQFVDQGFLDPKDPADNREGQPRLATATQSQKGDDDIPFGGKKIHCMRSTVRLQTAAHSIELITWFSAGLGIVQQEQRTDDKLLVRLTLLDTK
jgi:hypothetical protein